MSESDRFTAAFTYASEKTKQLITLATSILAITITFSKDVLGGVIAWAVLPLFVAWILYLVSIVAGVQLLGRLAARLQAAPIGPETLDEHDIDGCARWQVGCFVWAVCFTIAFGICDACFAVYQAGGFSQRLPPAH